MSSGTAPVGNMYFYLPDGWYLFFILGFLLGMLIVLVIIVLAEFRVFQRICGCVTCFRPTDELENEINVPVVRRQSTSVAQSYIDRTQGHTLQNVATIRRVPRVYDIRPFRPRIDPRSQPASTVPATRKQVRFDTNVHQTRRQPAANLIDTIQERPAEEHVQLHDPDLMGTDETDQRNLEQEEEELISQLERQEIERIVQSQPNLRINNDQSEM